MNPTDYAATLAGGLDDLRAYALARMTSRANVHRAIADPEKVDGYDVPEWDLIHVGIPFRLVGGDTRKVTVGGVDFQDATARGDFPWDTFDLADDDLVEIVEGEWADSVFRIVKAVKGDQRTARRVPVVEVPRPEEWP